MVREINNPGGLPVAGNNGRVDSRQAAEQAGRPAPASAAPAETAGQDPVRLSDDAQAMRAMEQKLLALPEVNETRVAEIKAALASGEYQVNDLVIADKLLAFEKLFD